MDNSVQNKDSQHPSAGFFREHWATFDANLSNHAGNRWRVNDLAISLDAEFGDRWEAHANELMTIFLPEDLRRLESVSLCMNGLSYQTEVSELAVKPPRGSRTELIRCDDFPVPFWSRAGQKKVAKFNLEQIASLERATLWLKVWGGGEGTVEEPFTINGHPYEITSGKAIHDVVFSELKIDVAHLNEGENIVTLLSDTEHHGIEVLLPGPCLVLTFEDT